MTGMYRAVKVVRREDFEYERTFEREFEGIQRYEQVSQDHPGLVDVLHVGRDESAGFYYYVMELADDEAGGSEEVDPDTYKAKTLTSDMRRNSGRDVEDCVNIGISLAGALGHLHLAGLTHRDVKPSNIIFVKGVPKLADVGLVAATGQRTYVGTEGYVPPEGPGTSSADLYSLAMVLYELHTSKDRMDFPELPTNLEIPPTVNRDEWRALNTVICRAGSPDPGKRYDSAHSFALALRSVISSNIPGGSKKRRRGAGVFLALCLLGFVGAAVYGGYWLWNDTQSFVDDNANLFAENENSVENSANEKEPVIPILPKEEPEEQESSSEEIESDEKTPDESKDETEDEMPEEQDKPAADPEEKEETMPEEKPDDENQEGDKPLLVATEVTGQVKIMSVPTGATVWIDGEEVARTETSPLEFPTGLMELVLKYPGFRDTRRTVNVTEGFQLVNMALVPDRGPNE
ncbi:MAG: PEGA domain-containing protein, partial [Verrucomicrobiota bacterium]